jgi:Secretion system C-terminal sorting domain
MKVYEWKKDANYEYKFAGITQMDFIMNINATVGLSEISNMKDITIYPNPVINKLYLGFNQETQLDKLIITNTLGQSVFQSNDKLNSQEIDVSFLSSGVYYISIYVGNEQKQIKFIKGG